MVPAVLIGLLAASGLAACHSNGGGGADDGDDPGTPGPFPRISAVAVAEGLVEPVHITHAGDGSDRLFVVERRGTIRILHAGELADEPWLDISAGIRSTGSEQGLLGLAFPPDFESRRRFYVIYTDQAGDVVLARYPLRADADEPDASGAEILLTVQQPFANHNGGMAAFGPDGLLYISLGDGGSGGDPLGHGQDRSTLLGTLLRIDVEGADVGYAIPIDNPFAGDAQAREEIWAWGLRNPWRFSFDRVTGDLYVADVGQGAVEEINFQAAGSGGGENYGWNVMEGSRCFLSQDCDPEGLVMPVAEYANDAENCAVTGGYVYRGEEWPALNGIYVYGDFCSGRIWGLRRNAGEWESELMIDSGQQISTFGEGEDGTLYSADYRNGVIYRIEGS